MPIIIFLFLLQSFFWVPTYEKQGLGNPDRLLRYIQSSIGDAQILNPTLSADTASSSINNLLFDGLIDLDDQLNYRPRLARSWKQYEIAYLVIDPDYKWKGEKIGNASHWLDFLKSYMFGFANLYGFCPIL